MLVPLLITLQLTAVVAQIGLYKCPAPWVEYEDKCYKFEFVETSLFEAKEACNSDGASLVSVNRRLEHEFIASWLVSNSPLSLVWYTSGFKEISSADRPEDQEELFYWEGDGTEVQGAQYWLAPEDRTKPGTRIIYMSNGARWGWTLIQDNESPRSHICEISKRETYKILQSERGFDYGVPVLNPEALERGPKFDLNPQDQIYEATEENPVKFVDFRCDASALPYPEYTWYRTRQQVTTELDPSTDHKFTITNGRLVIHLPRDTVDNGDYLCKAENQYGAVLSRAATLRFGYLNDFPDTQRDAVEVDAHKGIGMDCDPPKHGYATLSYSWYKDRYTNFIFTDRKPHLFLSRDGKLYFSTATKDDEGQYVCVVAVPGVGGGKHSMPISLMVRESSGNVYEPEMVNGFPKVFPSSTLRGDDVYLECVAWGSLPLDYYWERLDDVMPPHAVQLDNNRVLKIPNVQVEHNGRYKCTVTRRNGQSMSGEMPMEIRAAPYFPIGLRSQHVDKGADLTWRCYGKGLPEVKYQWYRDAAPLIIDDLVPDDQVRYAINKNVLTIKEVMERDEGMYQCRINNTLGAAFSSGQLRTIAFPPTFDKYPLPPNQYATKGSTTTIICSPESAPPSEKFWTKDGRALNPSTDELARVRLLPNGNLHITRVTEADKGLYSCKAVNTLGEAESSGNLTILSATTIGSSLTMNQHVRANSTAFLFCDATFNPGLDLTYDWWHNNYHIEFERLRVGSGNIAYFELDKHYRRGTGINRGGLFIHDVQQWHAGDYICVTKTSSDEQRLTSHLHVVGPPSPPAGVTAADADARSIDISWWPGSDNGAMTQYYIAEGYNILEAVWRRLKTNIRAPANRKMVTERISGLSPGSQYRFRVRAVNEYGEGDASDQSEQIYYTEQAPPEVAPSGLGGGGGKVGDLKIIWTAIPSSEYNGKNVIYHLHYKKQSVSENDKWQMKVIESPEIERFVALVGPTNFYTIYDVKIQALNEAGPGPMSEMVPIYSAEEMPIAVPRDVKAVYYNSTAIMSHFTSVNNTRESMRGILGGYRINYWKTYSEDETMAQFRIIKGQANKGLIIGLQPNTYYTTNVQAFNTAGLTAVSEDYVTRTLRYAPKEAPQEVKVRINSDHEVQVVWRGVSTTIDEEPLEGYMVRLWRRGENVYVAEKYDADKKARIVISDLEPMVMYQLRVYGYSRGGVGLHSSPTIEFILGDNCKIFEDSPEKEYIYTCGGEEKRNSADHLRSSSVVFSVLILLYNLWDQSL